MKIRGVARPHYNNKASSLQMIQNKNMIVIQLQNSLSNFNEINLVGGVKYSSGHVQGVPKKMPFKPVLEF